VKTGVRSGRLDLEHRAVDPGDPDPAAGGQVLALDLQVLWLQEIGY